MTYESSSSQRQFERLIAKENRLKAHLREPSKFQMPKSIADMRLNFKHSMNTLQAHID